ncbi:MAG: NAD(P)-dependent oxidoreductase [Aquificaceae bacterium]|jgi:3-hydroxyisobutyrate dehydrogenase|uniref:NAD(P)-dependent oxidoreductase n=1 Tax=Hydrogenobacter sp. Uz 6-8 TaxID=3384828 RepID=UPI000F10CADA|nr:MAG: NAD(P)-dependent oxidoreductase [Aquificota bacterium]
MRLGFIGLGSLGRAIVKRLVEQGVDVLLWNRTREKALELGLPVVESPADLIRQVDRVFIIVFDSQASEEVIFGKGGLVEGGVKGKTIVDMTTNHYAYARTAYEELSKLGAFYLDAPILGSVIPAQKGELTVLVGGDRERFEENRHIFEKFCKNIFYVGTAGNASKLKLINNIVLGGFMQVLSEAIALGELAGFSRELLINILESGAGKSYLLEVKKKKLLEKDYSVHFSVDLIHKDLHYAEDMIKDLGAFSFSVQNVKNAYALAKYLGMGGEDFSVLVELYRRLRAQNPSDT